MLRRKSGESSMLGGGFGVPSMGKFKVPSLVLKRPERALPPRKVWPLATLNGFYCSKEVTNPLKRRWQRAKVSYKDGDVGDDDDDDDAPAKKKARINPKVAINAPVELDENGDPISEINVNRKFAIYAAKDKESVFRRG